MLRYLLKDDEGAHVEAVEVAEGREIEEGQTVVRANSPWEATQLYMEHYKEYHKDQLIPENEAYVQQH